MHRAFDDEMGAIRESGAILFGITDGRARVERAADEERGDVRLDGRAKVIAEVGVGPTRRKRRG